MAYEVVMSYHLHMPSYFLGTFTEYPNEISLHYFLILPGEFSLGRNTIYNIIKIVFLHQKHNISDTTHKVELPITLQ
jgi:sigma-B regulation protein RsbU (phosphoserine phosphatase)